MFGKLMKHEFRATSRVMLPVLAALVVLAVLANISFGFVGSVSSGFLDILMGILIAAYFLCIFAAGIICLVIMIERFYHNILCDQGYITMTLPTSVHAIVWSKLLVSLVWTIVTALLIILTMFFTVMTISSMSFGDMIMSLPDFSEIIAMICEDTGFTVAQLWGLCIEGVIVIIVSSLYTFLHFYAAMSLGHIFARHKVLLSVVFFLALNFVLSILSSGMAYVVGNSIENAISSMSYQIFSYFLHYMLALIVVEGTVLYFTTTISLKRGLNLS